MPSGAGAKYFPDINGSAEVHCRKKMLQKKIPGNCVPKTEQLQHSGISKKTSASVPCSGLSFQSFFSRTLTSFPTCGGPRHSPAGSNFTPVLCFHRLKALRRILILSLVSTRYTTYWGFPPCALFPYIMAVWE